ncbi:MAG: hypothetical protein Q8M15_06595 [Bacteroidota bacterium]|nr:hypothetical protein [Bacteroidota bacterium]
MVKNLLFVICILMGSVSLYGQNSLLFINPVQNKLIKAKIGDQLSLQYYGYLGQTEYFKQSISLITDSSVILGVYFPQLSDEQSRKIGSIGFTHKEILLKDITMFRKMGVGRTLIKATLGLGTAFTSIYLLNRFYEQNRYSTPAKFGISIGVAIGTTALINFCFPDRPKYKIKDGWKVESLK